MTPASDGRVARFWDAHAAQYDAHYDTVGTDGYALRARRDLAAGLLGDGPGAVLDAGMGAGRLCEALTERQWTVFGVDASAEMVGLARGRLPDARDRLAQGSVEQLSFEDASFDAVAATGVLEYTDVPRALGELARVLRPGGSAVLSYPNPRALYGLWKTRVWYPLLRVISRLLRRPRAEAPKGRFNLGPSGFAAAAEAAGLRVESVRYTNFLVFPSPLDELLPGVAARLGERLEGAPAALGRVLATQVVYVAQKPVDVRAEL